MLELFEPAKKAGLFSVPPELVAVICYREHAGYNSLPGRCEGEAAEEAFNL